MLYEVIFMKDLTQLENGELIDYVYTNIAGQHIRDNVKDWKEPGQLTNAVAKLKGPAKTTYLIGILNWQVMNGGFIQYYNNSYGQFAYETLTALKEINASGTHDLLKASLEIINPNGEKNSDFREFINKREYNIDTITENRLDKLDDKYYDLADTEDLEQLLGNYLKLRITELK
jgi:Domain of unknown function (DUF4375)